MSSEDLIDCIAEHELRFKKFQGHREDLSRPLLVPYIKLADAVLAMKEESMTRPISEYHTFTPNTFQWLCIATLILCKNFRTTVILLPNNTSLGNSLELKNHMFRVGRLEENEGRLHKPAYEQQKLSVLLHSAIDFAYHNTQGQDSMQNVFQ